MEKSFTRPSIAAVLLATSLVLSSCGGDRGQAADNTNSEEKNTIVAGWVPALSWICMATAVESLNDSDSDTTVDLVSFDSSQDMLVALQGGSIEIGPVGYSVFLDGLSSSEIPAKYHAGTSQRGTTIIAGAHSGIDNWEDLRGKTVGAIRGTAEYYKLYAAMEANGLTLGDDVEFVNVNSAADALLALERGDIDFTNSFEPNSAQAVAEGYAKRLPQMQEDVYTKSHAVDSGLALRDDFVEDKTEAAIEFLTHYNSSCEEVSENPELGVATFLEYQPGDEEVLQAAMEQMANDNVFETRLEEDQLLNVVQTYMDNNEGAPDMTEELLEHSDWSLISEATGQSETDRGKGQ